MNERIRELIEQCEYTTRHSYEGRGGGYDTDHFDTEKFAELILRECLMLFEEGKINEEDDVDYGLEEAKNIIKEHFGVKE